MIIVQLLGGLGNQMFQYAVGRRLAHHHNTELFLDITGFKSYALRKYELDIFTIHAKNASPDLLKRVSFSRKDPARLGRWHLFLWGAKIQLLKEQPPDFYNRVLNIPDNVYLEGYWQSEKYFNDITGIIKKDFSFINPPTTTNQELLEEIGECNSVSLHIRRGDYVSNPKTLETHGVLGPEYYLNALNLVIEKVKEPHIFVFSDDILWARENLKTDLPIHFIDNNSVEKGSEDLRLMNNCKHHIIANSSFSWWGAWLSNNPSKIVIAPQKWFSELEMEKRKKIDVVPDNWIKI